MLMIQRAANGRVVFRLCGRMTSGSVAEVDTLLQSEPKSRRIVLELKDLTLVDRDAVRFLARCEASGVMFTDCPAYIREWITGEKKQSEAH